MEEQLARAIDNFSDAERFAREAKRAAERGRSDEVKHFADLAIQAAQDGKHEMAARRD